MGLVYPRKRGLLYLGETSSVQYIVYIIYNTTTYGER